MATSPKEVKMEFAVQMKNETCKKDIQDALNIKGINNVFVDIANEIVLVDTTLPSSHVTQLLQGTGKLVVFRGIGGMAADSTSPRLHQGAAVAIMKGVGGVKGLARLVQLSANECQVDGTIDGLTPGRNHLVQIHEYGDLSSGCDNCGDVLGMMLGKNEKEMPAGYICSVTADERGRAVFQALSNRIVVSNIIGRSMVITSDSNDSTQRPIRSMCGIVARSAGLFQNTKKVCTCDGVTIWDEAKKHK